jgi:hypothetical protein
MEIYRAQEKKLDETARSVLENNLRVYHHMCQDNFYNSLKLGQKLLQHKINVCGTVRPNRGIPNDFEETKQWKRGQLSFRRKGVVMILVWKAETSVMAAQGEVVTYHVYHNARRPPKNKMSANIKYFTINFIHLIHKACQILCSFTNQCHCLHLHRQCRHLPHTNS